MYFDDHNPPHFHALYGDDEPWINIKTLAILSGRLPSRAFVMVQISPLYCKKRLSYPRKLA